MRTEFLLSEVGIGLRRNLTMSIASIVVVLVMLSLLGVALIVDRGTSKTKDAFYNQLEVSVYFDRLCGSTGANPGNCATEAEKEQVRQTLVSLPQVKSVQYISQADAYKRFKEEYVDDPSLLKSVGPNVLPDSYVVKLHDPQQFAVVSSAVSQAPGVSNVYDASKLLRRAFSIFHKITVVVLGFALILLVATVLLIYNAMRVAAFTRRRETGIMRLVGASNFAIQVPFVLEGTVIGVAGSALAVGALVGFREFAHHELNIPLLAQLGEWSTLWFALPIVIVIGVLLPSLASFLTLQRHLRV